MHRSMPRIRQTAASMEWEDDAGKNKFVGFMNRDSFLLVLVRCFFWMGGYQLVGWMRVYFGASNIN